MLHSPDTDMLSAFVADIREGNAISPARLGARLRLGVSDVAKLAHVHRNTLTHRPDSIAVQKALQPVVRILAAAEQLTDDPDRAIVWFLHQPIEGFDGRTACDLVTAGHAEAVLVHLEDLRDGAYA